MHPSGPGQPQPIFFPFVAPQQWVQQGSHFFFFFCGFFPLSFPAASGPSSEVILLLFVSVFHFSHVSFLQSERLRLESQLHELLGLRPALSGSPPELAGAMRAEDLEQMPVPKGKEEAVFDDDGGDDDDGDDATASVVAAVAVTESPAYKKKPAEGAQPPRGRGRGNNRDRDRGGDRDRGDRNNNNNNSNSNNDGERRPNKAKLRISSDTAFAVSGAIEQLYEEKRLTQAEIGERNAILARLQHMMEELFPKRRPRLQLFGSSVNGFGVKGSDMDLVLMIDDAPAEPTEPTSDDEGDEEAKKHPHAALVEKVVSALTSLHYPDVVGIATARIPVVKFKEPASGLVCDICFNNGLALRNSQLLATYSGLDPRVCPLVFAVKNWAKNRRVNAVYEGSLSSYAYVLMVVQFLQSRRPAILPVLQDMWPASALRGRNRKKVMVAGYDTYFYQNMEDSRLKEYGSKNKENLGVLLFDFFVFYGYVFGYRDRVVSPRTGQLLTKADKGWTHPIDKPNRSNYWFCIEDPFEVSHNLGRTVDKGSLYNLVYEFRRAANILAGQFNWEAACPETPRGTVMEMLMMPFSKVEINQKL